MIAKGVRMKDGTYLYTCGHCSGKGWYRGVLCSHCYALNTDNILKAMRDGAQGERYYALLKAFLSVHGKAIRDEGQRIYDQRHAINPVELGYISLKFGLNFKATVEWLHECGVMRTAYDSVRWPKVSDIYAAAREQYADLLTRGL